MTTPVTAHEPVNCQNCQNQLGEIVNVKGIDMLHAGGGLWRDMRGYCAQCGKPFYWATSDRQFSDVIRLFKAQ